MEDVFHVGGFREDGDDCFLLERGLGVLVLVKPM